ncbi:MAG: FAD-dependent oxidoreductase [Anaerotardibacter sp.]
MSAVRKGAGQTVQAGQAGQAKRATAKAQLKQAGARQAGQAKQAGANQPSECASIAIIGGGASGVACAIYLVQSAKQTGRMPKIVLFEAAKRPGRTILQSGNGRCNFSNAFLDRESYQNASFVTEALSGLDSKWDMQATAALHTLLSQANNLEDSACQNAVVSWFESLGLLWTMASEEGLLYPETNKSSTVWDVLEGALNSSLDAAVEMCADKSRSHVEMRAGVLSAHAEVRTDTSLARVEIRTDTPIACVEKCAQGFSVVTEGGTKESFTYVVVASGGKTPKELLGNFNLSYFKPYPVLCPIEVKGDATRDLNGLRVKASLRLVSKKGTQLREKDCCQTGEVLFRDYGLSGIAVFNLSRYAKPGDQIILSLFPEFSHEQLSQYLSLRFEQAEYACLRDFLQGLILTQLAALIFSEEELEGELAAKKQLEALADSKKDSQKEAIAESTSLESCAAFRQDYFASLATRLKTISFTVKKNRDDQSCQLHRGGVSVQEVSSSTMEVEKCPGLYVLGEALDVDAPCGGYNLHWAFATGLVAGASLAEKLGFEQPFITPGQEVV